MPIIFCIFILSDTFDFSDNKRKVKKHEILKKLRLNNNDNNNTKNDVNNNNENNNRQ